MDHEELRQQAKILVCEWRRDFWYSTAMLATVSFAGLMELLYYDHFILFVMWGVSFALWLDNVKKQFLNWRNCVSLLGRIQNAK